MSRRHNFGYFPTVDEEVVPVLRVEDAAFSQGMGASVRAGLSLVRLCRTRGGSSSTCRKHTGDAAPNTLIHLYVNDIDAVAEEFAVPVEEEGLAGRECDLADPDGNRLRVATRRAYPGSGGLR